MSKESEVKGFIGVVVAAFPDVESGDEALKTFKEAKELKYIYFEDAAVIRQDADGGVHYHETDDMSTGKGSGIGALIGGVIGILGGPAGVVIGAGAGAIVGGAAAHGDAGFNDESLEQLGVALKPGSSALALLANEKQLKSLREQVSDADIRTAVAELSDHLAAYLEEGKSVALGIVLTEEGLALTEVASSNKAMDVIVAVAAKDGVFADTSEPEEEPENYYVQLDPTVSAATPDTGGVTREGNLPG